MNTPTQRPSKELSTDELLDELAGLAEHWQRLRAQKFTPQAIRMAMLGVISEIKPAAEPAEPSKARVSDTTLASLIEMCDQNYGVAEKHGASDMSIWENLGEALEELRERRAAHEPPVDQAEIVTVEIKGGKVVSTVVYAPGLPDGVHSLYCERPAQPPAPELPTPINHDLWRHLHDEHGLTLTQSELDEILRHAQPKRAVQGPCPHCGTKWVSAEISSRPTKSEKRPHSTWYASVSGGFTCHTCGSNAESPAAILATEADCTKRCVSSLVKPDAAPRAAAQTSPAPGESE